jgi:hypothetical protein
VSNDEAYERGYADYKAGIGIYQNPYPENTVEFRRWVDGRVQAIVDERPVLLEIANSAGESVG